MLLIPWRRLVVVLVLALTGSTSAVVRAQVATPDDDPYCR